MRQAATVDPLCKPFDPISLGPGHSTRLCSPNNNDLSYGGSRLHYCRTMHEYLRGVGRGGEQLTSYLAITTITHHTVSGAARQEMP